MKTKIFLWIFTLAIVAASCNRSDDDKESDGFTEVAFKVKTPSGEPQLRGPDIGGDGGEVPTRFVLGVYEEGMPPEQEELATGEFLLRLKKDVSYSFYFWADYGTPNADRDENYYDASDLKAVTVTDKTKAGEPAFYGHHKTNGIGKEVNITLEYAVAKVVCESTDALKEDNNTLTVTYPSGATFDVSDGTLTENDTEVKHTFGITRQEAGVIATDYILAPAKKASRITMAMQLNDKAPKSFDDVPVKANYVICTRGAFNNWYNNNFSIIVDKDWAGHLTPETVLIPKGSFMRGSPENEPGRESNETQHQVTLTWDFYIGKYPVTNAQYAAFLNTNGIGQDGIWKEGMHPIQVLIKASPSKFNWGLNWDRTNNKWVPVPGYERHPVIYVSWYGADAYARYLGGRLPSEAEWEYACRGDYANKATETNTQPFGIGTGGKLTGDIANFNATYPYELDRGTPGEYEDPDAFGLYKQSTTPVGYYDNPNNYGLYDMHGNVLEWCNDWYTENYERDLAKDPRGGVFTTLGHVVRGGNWSYSARNCRSAFRTYSDLINTGSFDIGFRIVIAP